MSLDVQKEAQQEWVQDWGEEAMAAGRSRGRGAPRTMPFPSYQEGSLAEENHVKNSWGTDSFPRAH